MNKPIKPEITIPQSFAENGVKTDFDDTLLADGFDNLRPDVLAGDNLNKFIDDTYKGLNYGMAAADALNLINEGETLIVRDGKFTSGAAGGGGLEIGDIGIAPLGIDETKGKRRYLNGQLIIQEQYVQFANKVKSAVALYPSLACSESEWQTTETMTVGGQVGKFVVDDEAGTIRLPKIIMPIQGLTDLSKLAEIVEAGLPNITGASSGVESEQGGTGGSGALYTTFSFNGWAGGAHNERQYVQIKMDASRSNPIYGNSNTVQQEQIQYPYFIQVATGAETEDNIINEIELNNPFFYGMSQYFESEPNNISWLKSAGQWNPKAVYPAYYDWALTNFNNGVEGFALSTGEYTDYDVVINPADETFRLPLLDGSENLPSDRYEDLTLLSSGSTYTAPANGWVNVAYKGQNSDTYVELKCDKIESSGYENTTNYGTQTVYAKRGDIFSLTYRNLGLREFRFIYAQGNGSLYYYVGETVQNANLINAGRIEEKIAALIPDNSSLISGYAMPSSKYINLTLGASGTTYTAPANGWLYLVKQTNATNQYITVSNTTKVYSTTYQPYLSGAWNAILFPISKGDVIKVEYNAGGSVSAFRFIYAEGEQ